MKEQTLNIFWGTNENIEFSNFAIRPFKIYINSKEFIFKSVEQGFHFYKAFLADNSEIANKILNTTNGAILKKLTNKNNLKLTKEQIIDWDNKAKDIMLNLMYQSYIQNPEMAKKLVSTGNIKITHVQDNTRWKTDFPKIVETVREMLKNRSNE